MKKHIFNIGIIILLTITIVGCGSLTKSTTATDTTTQLASYETKEDLATTVKGTVQISKSDFDAFSETLSSNNTGTTSTTSSNMILNELINAVIYIYPINSKTSKTNFQPIALNALTSYTVSGNSINFDYDFENIEVGNYVTKFELKKDISNKKQAVLTRSGVIQPSTKKGTSTVKPITDSSSYKTPKIIGFLIERLESELRDELTTDQISLIIDVILSTVESLHADKQVSGFQTDQDKTSSIRFTEIDEVTEEEKEEINSNIDQESKLNDLKTKAKKHLKNHEFDKAVQIYKEVLEKKSLDPETNIVLGIHALASIIEDTDFQNFIQKTNEITGQTIAIPKSINDIQNKPAQPALSAPSTIEESKKYHELYTHFRPFIDNGFIPKLEESITHFSRLLNDDSFTSYELPTEFTGLETNHNIGKRDISLILFHLYTIEFYTKSFFAYDWDINNTDDLLSLATQPNLENFDSFLENNENFGKLAKPDYYSEARLSLIGLLELILATESYDNTAEKNYLSKELNITGLSTEVKDIITLVLKSLKGEVIEVSTDAINFNHPLSDYCSVYIRPQINPDNRKIKVRLDKLFTNPSDNIFDFRKIIPLDSTIEKLQASDFPDSFDFTLNGLFPEMTTFEKWKNAINPDSVINNVYTDYELNIKMTVPEGFEVSPFQYDGSENKAVIEIKDSNYRTIILYDYLYFHKHHTYNTAKTYEDVIKNYTSSNSIVTDIMINTIPAKLIKDTYYSYIVFELNSSVFLIELRYSQFEDFKDILDTIKSI